MDLIRDTSSARSIEVLSVEDINRAIVDLNTRLDAIWDVLAQITAVLPPTPAPRPRGS